MTGSTPKSTEESYWNGKINWVTTDDLGKLVSKEIFESRRKITEEGFVNSGTHMAPIGSIALSTRAPIGHLGILKIEACTNQGCKTIISDNKFDSNFLYYFLYSGKSFLNSLGVGTTFIELPTQSLKDFQVPYPSVTEQTAIASYLDRKTSEIDELIADKKRLLELYEEEKTAIINELVTGKKVWDGNAWTEPAKVKDSGIEWLGEIPEHWEMKKLKTIASVQTGRTPKIQNSQLDYFESGEYNWFTPADFEKNNELIESRRKIIKEAIESNEVELFPEYSIYLVSIGATLGKVSFFREKASANQQINIISFKDGFDPLFGYYFLVGNKEMITLEADYTTLPILNQSKTKTLLFAVPPIGEQKSIVHHIETECTSINTQIKRTKKLIELLTEYRTALISEVVTGKIKVTE